MRKRNMLLCLVLVLACGQLFATGTRQTATASNDIRQVLTLYWDTSTRDVDWYGAPIPTRIREKTGVTVEYRGVLGNEAEQLNIALATGNLPDIISGALWGGQHAMTILFQRAAQQGQIVPIEQYISKYENVSRAFQIGVISQQFMDAELRHPAYGGQLHLLPQDVSGTTLDMQHYPAGIAVRGDVGPALGIDPTTIKTSAQLLDFMRKAQAYGFRDVNGNPTITAGCGTNGFEYPYYWDNFKDKKLSAFIRNSDGTVTHEYLTPAFIERNIFMWRLVNEGIFDREAFRHSGTMVDTKMGNFTYLFSAGHVSSPNNATKTTNAYYTNPEMRYTYVGPLNFADGSPGVAIESMGASGFAVLAFSRVNRDVDASLRYLDYCNSKEGVELIHYGLEGVTFYRNALGQPRLLPSIMEARANRVTDWDKPLIDLGTNIFRRYDLAWMNTVWFGEYTRTSGDPDPMIAAFEKAKPAQQLPGYSIEGFTNQFPETDALSRLDADQQERTYRERAYFAATEAEARQILASFQTWLRTAEGGVWMRYLDFLAQMARTRSDVAF